MTNPTGRSYYNAIYSRDGKLRNVIRYYSHADLTNSDARQARDEDAAQYDYWSGVRVKPVTAREAWRLARRLLGLQDHERFFGRLVFCEPTSFGNGYIYQAAPAIITH